MKYSVFFGLVSLLLASTAKSEDIELFVKHNVNIEEKPRVMIVFDTSGSMAFSSEYGTSCGYDYYRRRWILCPDNRLGVAKDTITDLIEDKANENVDFGLMRFNSDNEGGYVLSGIGSSKSDIKNKINTLEANGGTPLSETLWEAYLYLTGKKKGYADNQSIGRDQNIELGDQYISPFTPKAGEQRCNSAVNVILMTDGDPSVDTSSNSDISKLYKNTFKQDTPVIENSYMPALAAAMHGRGGKDPVEVDLYPNTSDLKDTAYVYTIGFGEGMSGAGEKILRKTAALGGGDYYQADTAEKLKDDFNKILVAINQRSSSFVSPSVSMNSSDQTQSGNSLYYTMFYPEKHTRWQGNLKKLQVKDGEIIDMSNKPALDTQDGIISKDATTFWSKPGSNDGNNIEQGGVNYQLSQQTSRKLFSDFGVGSLIPFKWSEAKNAVGATQLMDKFGTSTDAETKDLMDWVSGLDVLNENSDSGRRKDIFGDPLHSKPVNIDYGNNDIRVFIGTNSGFLHAFKDNGNTVKESWAFLPGKLLDIQKPLMNKLDGTKLYGVDGPITVFHKDINRDSIVNGTDKVWLFFGLRRGGTAYYALDITNPDTPKMLWGAPITSQKSGFEELGQSWSKPFVTYIRSQKEKPVVIFGAGYDTNKDNISKTSDSKGRGLFIVDAESGNLVWSLTPGGPASNTEKASKFKGIHSIAADVSLMDSDYDGFTDRIYAADTGGSIWRVDMPRDKPNDTDNPWTHFKFAELSGSKNRDDRRFFYQPLVARTFFSKVTKTITSNGTYSTRREVPYEAIIIGSGNRASPLEKIVNNQLYVIRDENTVTRSYQGDEVPDPIYHSQLMQVKDEPFYQAASKQAFYEKEAELGALKGWKYQLRVGEKSLAKATVVGGIAYFTSFTPHLDTSIDQCSVGSGGGALYALHLHYGARVFQKIRYDTVREVPSTPVVLYHNESETEGGSKRSTGRLNIELKNVDSSGGKGPDGSKPSEPFLSAKVAGPLPTLNSAGQPTFLSNEVHGIMTKQMYIYKREDHDEK
ncbi:pilin biogenesis protein [Pseudoalteromonas phenolica]|uniref:PilC/PilY family type IV pilus protein n=1 Tax=Pseudoalteromonas phenolica TaxID=161398 RepID=UPI00110B0498|nr:PilC/PilY family type IV pilus protein [Pseudoalteromonas phenolica]TMN87419.1 pilin biogenesis protein [Pseudoalteromonas phenolica]